MTITTEEFICSMVNQNISDSQQIQAMTELLVKVYAYRQKEPLYYAAGKVYTIKYMIREIKILLKDKKRNTHNLRLRGIDRKRRQHKLKSELIPHTLDFINGELREKNYIWREV